MADSTSRMSKWDPGIMAMMKRRKPTRGSSLDAKDPNKGTSTSPGGLPSSQETRNVVNEPIQILTENIVSSPLQTHESSIFGGRPTMNEAKDSRPLYTETMSVESWEIEKKILAAQNISWGTRHKLPSVPENEIRAGKAHPSSTIYETVLDQSSVRQNIETAVPDTFGRPIESEILLPHRTQGIVETSVNERRSNSLPGVKSRVVSPFETMKSDLGHPLSTKPISRKTLPVGVNAASIPRHEITEQSSKVVNPPVHSASPLDEEHQKYRGPPPQLPPRRPSDTEEKRAVWVTEAQRTYFNKLSESKVPNVGRPPTVSPPPPPPPPPPPRQSSGTGGQILSPGPNIGRPPEKASPFPDHFFPPPPPTPKNIPSYPSTFNPDPISNKPPPRSPNISDPPPQYVPHSKPQTYHATPNPIPLNTTTKVSALDLPFVTRNCRYRRPRFGVTRPGDVFWRPSLDTTLGELILGVDSTLQIDICNDCFEGWKNDNPYRSPIPGSWVRRNRNEPVVFCELSDSRAADVWIAVSATKSLVPYESFVQQLLQMSTCPGLAAVENQRDMYILNLPPNKIRPSVVAPWLTTPLHICQRCYYELCVGTTLENCFSPTRLIIGNNIASNVCVAGHWVQPRMALLMAASENDIGIFTSITLSTVLYNTSQTPPSAICDAHVGTFGPKYNFRQRFIYNFAICEYCVYTVAAMFPQLNQQLVLQPHPQSDVLPRRCGLNVATSRFGNIMTELQKSYVTRDVTAPIQYLSELFALPPCTLEVFSGDMSRVWYTTAQTPDVVVCAECEYTTVRGTPLANLFYVRPKSIPGNRTACDLYSVRSRKSYFDACERGSITEFANFAIGRGNILGKIIALKEERDALPDQKGFQFYLIKAMLDPLLKEYESIWV